MRNRTLIGLLAGFFAATFAWFSPALAEKPNRSAAEPLKVEVFDKFAIENKETKKESTEAAPAKTARPVRATLGNLCDPQRIEIKGAVSFSAGEIRTALLNDRELLAASTASSPLGPYLIALHDRLVAGYRHMGFPDPVADVALDHRHGRILIAVTEGMRYVAGSVRVQGASDPITAEIVSALIQRQPGDKACRRLADQPLDEQPWQWLDKDFSPQATNGPLWVPNEPAPFDEVFMDEARRAVERAVAWQGFLSPKFEVKVAPREGAERIADLVIQFSDVGRAADVDRIEVTGVKRASVAKILEATGLKQGIRWTRFERDRVERVLWHSARLKTFDFELDTPAGPQAPLVMRLSVVENDRGPVFGEPASPAEEAILRVRQWVLDFARRGDDLIFDGEAPGFGSGKLVISTQGTFLRFCSARSASPASEYELLVAPNAVGLYSTTRGRKLEFERMAAQCVALAQVKMLNPVKDEQRYSLTVGFGSVGKSADHGEHPFRLDLLFAPVVLCDMLLDNPAKLSDGRLVLEGKCSLRANLTTGEFMMRSEAEDGLFGQITVKRGEFSREAQQLKTRTQGQPNDYRAGQPVASLARLIVDEPQLWLAAGRQPPDKQLSQSLRGLIDRGVFGALDTALAKVRWDTTGQFTVPASRAFDPMRNGNSTSLSSIAWMWGASLWLPKIFPADSWPYWLCHDGLVAADGKTDLVQAAIGRVVQWDRTGPLAYIVLSQWYKHSAPRYSLPFARRGLTRLSTEDFRRDYDLLLNPSYIPGQCVLRLADAIRQMDEAEQARLRASAKAVFGEEVAAMIERLIESKERPSGQVLAAALDELWEKHWRDQAAKDFDKLEVDGLIDRARDFAERGFYNQALRDIDNAIGLRSCDARSLQLRAWLGTRLGDYDKSLADYRQILRENPKDIYATTGLAWLLATCPDAKIRDQPQAIELAKRACELTDWKQQESLATLVTAYAEAGDFAAAIKFQRQAANLVPAAERGPLTQRLERLEHLQGEHKQAERK